MKIFAVLGAILLVAFHQTNAQPTAASEPGSFAKDVERITNSMLAGEENPSNMVTLASKISALTQASYMHDVDFQVYGSIYDTLNRQAYVVTGAAKPGLTMQIISRTQDNTDEQFDKLNVHRDVDEINLPSEANDLIDEFIKRHTESFVSMFETLSDQAQKLEQESEERAGNTIKLVDGFVEGVDRCLQIPRNQFREVFECREETRKALPGLAHDTAMMEIIGHDLRNLSSYRLDNSLSLEDLEWQLRSEIPDLMYQISVVKQKREDSREEQQQSEESSEQVNA